MVTSEGESHDLPTVVLSPVLHRLGGELGSPGGLEGSHPLRGTAGMGFGSFATATQQKRC